MPHKDPARLREYQREYQRKYQWVRKLKRVFGLTEQDYYDLLESQGGGCAICGTADNPYGWGNNQRRLPVDHDHESGRVRGILCDLCNRAIGLMQEDPERLRVAAAYLDKE